MELADFSKPGERKKLLWAAILGLLAIVLLWWTFFGFGKAATTPQRATSPQRQTPPVGVGRRTAAADSKQPDLSELIDTLQEVKLPTSMPVVAEARRNIFAFYEPPPTVKVADAPTPTPTPTPPVLLASVSPGNVYARTADFTLEVSGDKFTPDLKIFVDGRDIATKFKGPQQLSATVAASMIANPGTRQIAVRSADGRVYSNSLSLNVAPPPTPNYTYVGILSKRGHVDIAFVQDTSSKAILNVQRGDVLSGRFRVTSIADKELVMVDTTLKITHKLAMTEGEKGFGSPLARPTPRVDAEDDEPDE